MLNFFYNPSEPVVSEQAKKHLDAWWDSHHASKVRYLIPGHRILVDGQVVLVSSVNGTRLQVHSLVGGWDKTFEVTEDQRFRHPLTDKAAEQALASLPPDLSFVVRVAEAGSVPR